MCPKNRYVSALVYSSLLTTVSSQEECHERHVSPLSCHKTGNLAILPSPPDRPSGAPFEYVGRHDLWLGRWAARRSADDGRSRPLRAGDPRKLDRPLPA